MAFPQWLLIALATAPTDAAPFTGGMVPPGGTFQVSTRHDFTLTLTARQAVPAGSKIRIITPAAGGWSRPSLDPAAEPESPGSFALVRFRLEPAAPRAATLEGQTAPWTDRGPPYGRQDNKLALELTVTGGGLEPGDKVVVEFPQARVGARALHRDEARNVAGYRAQALLPGGEWIELPGLPQYTLVHGPARALHLRAPSLVVAGEPCRLTLAVLDGLEGNPVHSFAGAVRLESSDPAAELPAAVTFEPAQQGAMTVAPITFRTPGRHTVTARSDTALEAAETVTARIEVLSEPPPLRLFWAELHNHGALSFDARNWGGCTMRPADQFWFGRDIMNLDVCAVTDHSMHSAQMRQQNMTEEQYQEIQRAAAAAYEPGEYVAFTALESRDARGDTNVYFLTDDEPYYMRDRLLTVEELWGFYRGADIITIPHLHPPVNRPARFDGIDPSKERAVEIHSNHGRYEFDKNEPLFPAKGMVPGNNVQAILSRGHRLGIVAASDDHSGRPGLRDLTGIWARERTRQAVFEALRARHTFGTTGPRTNLSFALGEAMMGDELRLRRDDPRWTARTFTARIDATSEIERIEVIRNGQVLYAADPDGQVAQFDYTDLTPLDQATLGSEKNNPPTAYYYLRVTQTCDRQGPARLPVDMAWTSPVFISPE